MAASDTGRGIVVELAGPAGAGKSTLAGLLRGMGTSVTAGPAVGLVRRVWGLAALAPSLVVARLSSPGRSLTRDELRSLAYLNAWRSRLDAVGRPAGLVVLDHGPVFRLASLVMSGPPMTRTRAFMRLWERLARRWGDLLDVVVWLDAPDAELEQRIRRRAQPHRVKTAAAADVEEFLAGYRAAYRTTLAAVTLGNARLVELDSGAHRAEELMEMVVAEVLRIPSRWSS